MIKQKGNEMDWCGSLEESRLNLYTVYAGKINIRSIKRIFQAIFLTKMSDVYRPGSTANLKEISHESLNWEWPKCCRRLPKSHSHNVT